MERCSPRTAQNVAELRSRLSPPSDRDAMGNPTSLAGKEVSPVVNSGAVFPAHRRKCGPGGSTAVGCRSSEHPAANSTSASASGIRARGRIDMPVSKSLGVLPGHSVIREVVQLAGNFLVVRIIPRLLVLEDRPGVARIGDAFRTVPAGYALAVTQHEVGGLLEYEPLRQQPHGAHRIASDLHGDRHRIRERTPWDYQAGRSRADRPAFGTEHFALGLALGLLVGIILRRRGAPQ